MKKYRRVNHKKRMLKIVVPIIIVLLFWFFTFVAPLYRVYARKTRLSRLARETFTAAKQQDLVSLKKNIGLMQTEVDALKQDIKIIYIYKHIPFAGFVFSDLENGLKAGTYLLAAGKKSVVAIEPYADLIGFKKGSEFSNQSTEKRLETAILTIDKLVPQINVISKDLSKAQFYLNKINPDRYPKKIGPYKIREKIKNNYAQITGFVALATEAKPLFKELPTILGKNKEQKYLILFLNDKELRPTGGFITAYAIFAIDKGQIRVKESSDIYDLDSTISHPKAPSEILRYHKGVSRFFIRDSNISPDYVKSIEYFEDLLNRSSRNFEYDGIVSIDTSVLVKTLEILGPTTAGGITFSADNDSRCDCPQVIYELENIITRPTPFFREQRKSILSVLLFNIMQKSLGVSPSQYWGRLSQSFLSNLEEKHILIYLKDKKSQKAIESIGYGGRIKKFNGDYLHINNVNFAGAKSNLYTSYELESTAQNKGNMIQRELHLIYRNTYPASNCNLEKGGLCLNAPLRNWVRIYVPKQAKLIKFIGSEMPVRTYIELGKRVFEGFLIIKPMGRADITVTYRLPLSVITQKGYELFIQKQPGVEEVDATIKYNRKIVKKALRTDQIIIVQ